MSNNTRYGVVAPMPHFTHLMAMDILIPMVHPFSPNVPYWGREEDRDNPLNWVDFCPQFPHLFRLLKWWEGLAVDELPKYVRWQGEEDKIWMAGVRNWSIENGDTYFYGQMVGSDELVKLLVSDSDIPATEAEYNDYVTKLNSK